MYIKFTEGECKFLTKNKPYGVIEDRGTAVEIICDEGGFLLVFMQKSAYIQGNRWYKCNKDMIYVKFTTGYAEYLTPNMPYKLLPTNKSWFKPGPTRLLGAIIDDEGDTLHIHSGKCPHIRGNNWYFCDKFGDSLDDVADLL